MSAAVAAASCTPDPVRIPFDQSGEMVALSGGSAGPRAACHTCHGLDGGGDGARAPRLAALDPGYLVRQLDFFADGQRSHPQMSWLAKRLGSDERMAVSLHYAQMAMPEDGRIDPAISCTQSDAERLYHEGDPARGLQACASCHGAEGSDSDSGAPSLAGQSGAYLSEQLRRWRSGERYGDPLGQMRQAARALQEEEISPLADYIARGQARSRRPESPAGCP